MMSVDDRHNKKNKSNCRCRHPRFSMGYCHYRTCRHDQKNHYFLKQYDVDNFSEGENK